LSLYQHTEKSLRKLIPAQGRKWVGRRSVPGRKGQRNGRVTLMIRNTMRQSRCLPRSVATRFSGLNVLVLHRLDPSELTEFVRRTPARSTEVEQPPRYWLTGTTERQANRTTEGATESVALRSK
jgi:hypothetical protein